MDNEFAGKFIKCLYEYNKTGVEPDMDFVMRMATEQFFNQFKRDNEKYEKICKRNSANGANGGRPKKTQPNPTKPTGLFDNPTKPKKADNDNDNDSDSDNKYSFEQFWDQYGKKTDRKKCEAKFNSLSNSDKEKIKDSILAYVESTPDIQYRKDPRTYLNGECWNNEIIKTSSKSNLPKHLRPDRKPTDNLTF